MKYNIALIPINDAVSNALIHLAHKVSLHRGLLLNHPEFFGLNAQYTASLYRGLPPNYLLRSPGSHPHVSVFQFELADKPVSSSIVPTENKKLLDCIKQTVFETYLEMYGFGPSPIVCTPSTRIDYKHGTAGPFEGITWCEILINKQENPSVQEFHMRILRKMAAYPIICMNASGECYNPHCTLFNIPTLFLIPTVLLHEVPPDIYQNFLPNIRLKPVLGVANDQWELIHF